MTQEAQAAWRPDPGSPDPRRLLQRFSSRPRALQRPEAIAAATAAAAARDDVSEVAFTRRPAAAVRVCLNGLGGKLLEFLADPRSTIGDLKLRIADQLRIAPSSQHLILGLAILQDSEVLLDRCLRRSGLSSAGTSKCHAAEVACTKAAFAANIGNNGKALKNSAAEKLAGSSEFPPAPHERAAVFAEGKQKEEREADEEGEESAITISFIASHGSAFARAAEAPEASLRRAAVEELCDLASVSDDAGSEGANALEAIAALDCRCRSDADARVRLAAVQALGRLAVSSRQSSSRQGVCAVATTELPGDRALLALQGRLDDQDAFVRQAALEAFARALWKDVALKPPSCLVKLFSGFAEVSGSEEATARRRRGVLGLAACLESCDEQVRRRALEALVKAVPVGDTFALAEVRKRLLRSRGGARRVAVEALAALAPAGDLRSRALLTECVEDLDTDVRRAARRALAALTLADAAAAGGGLRSPPSDAAEAHGVPRCHTEKCRARVLSDLARLGVGGYGAYTPRTRGGAACAWGEPETKVARRHDTDAPQRHYRHVQSTPETSHVPKLVVSSGREWRAKE